MREVNVTKLRSHLQKYLTSVHKSGEILITSHGQVIARLLPPVDARGDAIRKLKELRKSSKIGDVTSPVDESWGAEE